MVKETKIETIKIDIKEHPRQLNMKGVNWYVVTEENLAEFKDRFKKETGGELVFYVIFNALILFMIGLFPSFVYLLSFPPTGS